MAAQENDAFDIENIKPPIEIPSNEPDEKTKSEKAQYERKAMTPARRAEIDHDKHIESLNSQVDHHKDECEKYRLEICTLRELLDAERKESRTLSEDCVRLRERGWAAGWMGIWGSIMVVVGGVALGFAGCWPELTTLLKYCLAGGGVATSVCGLVLTILSHRANNRPS